MSKIVLNTSDFYSFSTFVLSTSISDDVQFIFKLNKSLEMHFVRDQDLDLIESDTEVKYQVYNYLDEYCDLLYQIIKNRPIQKKVGGTKEPGLQSLFDIQPYLVPSLSQFDYIVKIEGDISDEEVIEKFHTDKSVVNICSQVSIERHKALENIIF